VQRTKGVPTQIRVGIDSGAVMMRVIGSDLRIDYTAVGQTTRLATRMEQMALPGSILVTPEELRLAVELGRWPSQVRPYTRHRRHALYQIC
jgi:class 3 adenylate cyclase